MPYVPDQLDMLDIPKPKPDRHYRWLSTKPVKLSQWLLSFGDRPGYRLVPVGEVEELGLNSSYVDHVHQRIQFGDLTLGDIPREEYERRRMEIAGRQRDRRDAVVDQFMADATRPGIKPRVFAEMDEVEDYKKYATRESTDRVGFTPSPTDNMVRKPKSAA